MQTNHFHTKVVCCALASTLLLVVLSVCCGPHSEILALERSSLDPHIAVARKELVTTEKAEANARLALQEAEDQVPDARNLSF